MIVQTVFLLLVNSLFVKCKKINQVDSQFPNFYKFLANNAYICSPVQRADGSIVVFLSETEGKSCIMCNNEKHFEYACGRIITKNMTGPVSCFEVPPLCIDTYNLRYDNERNYLEATFKRTNVSMKLSKKLKRQSANVNTTETFWATISNEENIQKFEKKAKLRIGSKTTDFPKPANEHTCEDRHNLCCFWAILGECTRNPFWMKRHCAKTCGTCHCLLTNADKCKPLEIKCIVPTTPALITIPTTTRGILLETTTSLSTSPQTQKKITRPFTPPTNGFRRTKPTRTVFTKKNKTVLTKLTTTMPIMTTTVVTTTTSNCNDFHNECAFWSLSGECRSNPFYMRPNCQKSCNSCGEEIDSVYAFTPRSGCVNEHQLCNYWAHIGECSTNPNYMLRNCKLACRVC